MTQRPAVGPQDASSKPATNPAGRGSGQAQTAGLPSTVSCQFGSKKASASDRLVLLGPVDEQLADLLLLLVHHRNRGDVREVATATAAVVVHRDDELLVAGHRDAVQGELRDPLPHRPGELDLGEQADHARPGRRRDLHSFQDEGQRLVGQGHGQGPEAEQTHGQCRAAARWGHLGHVGETFGWERSEPAGGDRRSPNGGP
ncbi:hypothetical protein GCM10027030_24290 [Luteococcus sediminum]